MKRGLAAAVGVPSLVLAAIWTSPTDGAAQWTKNYYCQMSGGADVTHWANGTHGYWPGDCSPPRPTLEVPLDWWVASAAPVTVQERSGERPAFTAPPSRLAGLHDFSEHLVLLAQQADERHADWDRRYWEPERGFDTVVLAVRVADGAILATEVIDEVAYPFTNRGRTPVYANDRNGLPSWSLREVRLDVR